MKSILLGSKGFIGHAVYEALMAHDILPHEIATSSTGIRLDQNTDWLRDQLRGFDTVYLCAGRTGGVGRMASDPFSFIYPNVRIHMNVFEAASAVGVRRVVCVGSTTGYRDSPEPVHEDEYLDGELHPAYFVPGNAHRFIKRISMMHKDLETVFFRPSNVYGPGNSFDRQHAHVIEATVRKVAERMDPFIVWGTGTEIRDAIYIDDLARAIAAHGATCAPGDYNVGVGEEMSVNAIVRALCEHAKFSPDIKHDLTKPTAISARRVDCDKLKALGWRAQVPMRDGLARTYDWYLGQTG